MTEKIYIIRHGLTETNKKKIYSGWSGEPLCEDGISSLLKIGNQLGKLNIEKIYSSPIRRAIQTAQILNKFINRTIVTEEKLKEMKMGPWEGLSEKEIAERFPQEWKTWNTKPSKLRLNKRETLYDLQLRAINAIKKMANYSNCLKILAVTHVAIIRVLIIKYNNLSIDNYKTIDVPNCSVFLLDIRGQKKMTRIL